MTEEKISIAIAEGDGIGPEIMAVTLQLLEASEAPLKITPVEIGEKVYLKGHSTGIEPKTWETLKNCAAFLKAPITTPQGGGFKSLNVTVRGMMGLYANVRPCVAYYPYVATKHPGMDVVIVRENEEDLYTGIEYRQTGDEVIHALKIISRAGCERIVRYAFNYAVVNGRKKVTCFTKDNILKYSDGLFHRVFDEIGAEYPDIEKEHWIVDIGAAKLADTPGVFDVIVMPNLYGDILSDVAAQIAGSVGLAGSANIGEKGAMFEAIHGSAPRRAGQNLANPSGLILAAVQMLVYVGLPQAASTIHNAWLKTLEDGIHTYDIFDASTSKQKVGTKEFGLAVKERMGETPNHFKVVNYQAKMGSEEHHEVKRKSVKKELVGVDIFIDLHTTPDLLEKKISAANQKGPLKLIKIHNRGLCVWPVVPTGLSYVDQWRCRFTAQEKGGKVSAADLIATIQHLTDDGLDVIQTQNLYKFDGVPVYSRSEDEN